MSVAAVILAAGAGTRFNRDDPGAGPGAKLLAKARGRPLIEWAIGPALEAQLDELVVVSGALDLSAVVPDEATLLCNEDWHLGQAASLRVALDWCARQGHLAAVIGLGDLPELTADAWRAVAGAAGRPDRLRDLLRAPRAPRAARRRDLVAAADKRGRRGPVARQPSTGARHRTSVRRHDG